MQGNAEKHFDDMKEAANNFPNSTFDEIWGRPHNVQGMDRKANLVEKQKLWERNYIESDFGTAWRERPPGQGS